MFYLSSWPRQAGLYLELWYYELDNLSITSLLACMAGVQCGSCRGVDSPVEVTARIAEWARIRAILTADQIAKLQELMPAPPPPGPGGPPPGGGRGAPPPPPP